MVRAPLPPRPRGDHRPGRPLPGGRPLRLAPSQPAEPGAGGGRPEPLVLHRLLLRGRRLRGGAVPGLDLRVLAGADRAVADSGDRLERPLRPRPPLLRLDLHPGRSPDLPDPLLPRAGLRRGRPGLGREPRGRRPPARGDRRDRLLLPDRRAGGPGAPLRPHPGRGPDRAIALHPAPPAGTPRDRPPGRTPRYRLVTGRGGAPPCRPTTPNSGSFFSAAARSPWSVFPTSLTGIRTRWPATSSRTATG